MKNGFVLRYLLLVATLGAVLGGTGCSSSSIQPPAPAPAATPAIVAASAPTLRVFTAGQTPGFPSGAGAWDITTGPDGSMWFTDFNTPAIGKISANGHVTEYTQGLAPGAAPYGIVEGPDGNLWFSDGNGAIGRVTPTGTITEFSISALSAFASPSAIAVGPDSAIWSIAVGPPNILVRADINGNLTAFQTPANVSPDGSLAADASGNLWLMSLQGLNGIMAQRAPNGSWNEHATGLVAAATLCCPNYAPKRITTDFYGKPWFTSVSYLSPTQAGQMIGTIGTSGTKLFPADKKTFPPFTTLYPSGITTVRGNVWFVGDDPFQVKGALWRINSAGAQIGYLIPYNPVAIAGDPNGNIWITTSGFNNPAQIVEAIPQYTK